MIGIIVQLAVSWLIIWLFEKNDLRVLGFYPSKQRLLDFAFFLLVSSACCASGYLFRLIFLDQHWVVNPKLSLSLIAEGLWWNIKSVLFEELIFRGVLLYILIRKLGALKGIIISAIAFGIYHWFSFGVLGNPTQMLFVFLVTGIMGLLYAYGYAKSFSLYIPAAIHLGWNGTKSIIFSDGPIGPQYLIPVDGTMIQTDSYLIFYLILFFPIVSALVINFLILKKRKQEPAPPIK